MQGNKNRIPDRFDIGVKQPSITVMNNEKNSTIEQLSPREETDCLVVRDANTLHPEPDAECAP